ncbi:MAG: hypothetical protein ACUVUT_01970 [Candidatus Bipolaricaulia bacterium]
MEGRFKKMKLALSALLVLVLLLVGSLVGLAQTQTQAQPATPLSAPSPAFGLALSLPLITMPPLTLTTALTFIHLYAEAPLTLDLAARLGVAFYLSTTLLRADLTSVESSLLLFLNRGMARFYFGGGLGTFPYETFTALGNPYGPGMLLSLHELAGFRVTTGPFSIFTELKYEVMPNSLCWVDPDGDGDYEGVCDGNGALSALEISIGWMVNFGGAACFIPCPAEGSS